MSDWIFLPGESTLSMHRIVSAVASRFSVQERFLLGPRRSRHIAQPRMVAMWLSTLDGARTLQQIGRHFNRDHTTVIHARECVEGMIVDRREVGLLAEQLARDLGLSPLPSGRTTRRSIRGIPRQYLEGAQPMEPR